ncbi:PaaI family thioesterase [Paraferrimonas sedimenticola]|uniref:Thioesterase n=1 Tax=Paraferrimonas sedimenticola TaxID=375674 RepID=A0AA37RWV7_9GAMM|nr:PaaI family thioesterase [Paraferrimonas sedimenticola]GLP96449.1 thioesterase [Paraferrimonas sedimenticola]
MAFADDIKSAVEAEDYDSLLQLFPYARFLGMECKGFGDEYVFVLPCRESNLGNPTLPALHGGVISGFMEMSAMIHLMLAMQTTKVPKIVDISIDYIRAGYHRDSYVRCQITRQGRRVANVNVVAWQANRKQPIATARAHFLID